MLKLRGVVQMFGNRPDMDRKYRCAQDHYSIAYIVTSDSLRLSVMFCYEFSEKICILELA